MTTPIIIDTDPGLDDAVAILFAARAKQLDLRALTVVQGNCTVEHGTRNARKILHAAGRCDIPIAAGAPKPILRELLPGWPGHGPTGLGDLDDAPLCTPSPVTQAQSQGMGGLNAIRFLIETLLAAPEPITLIPIAPLTNIALALLTAPEIKPQIKELVIMGGAVFCAGNTTAAAEFNIRGDPEAAQIVFTAGVPLTLVGLDVTMKARLFEPHVKRLEAAGNPQAKFAARCVRYIFGHARRYDTPRMHLHDPLAVGVALDRSLVKTQKLRVDVETATGLALGQTMADTRAFSDATPNVDVCVEVDEERFVEMLLRTFGA